MKKKLLVIMASLGLLFGFGAVAPVVSAAPASAATYTNSSCHFHYGWITPTLRWKQQWCFRSYSGSKWVQLAHNGWYVRVCQPQCLNQWHKSTHRYDNGHWG